MWISELDIQQRKVIFTGTFRYSLKQSTILADQLVFQFSAEEKDKIQDHVAKYPDPKSAVMPALWIAQEKFGWLSNGALKLVAEELKLPYAHVYGVASFYTMYLKKDAPEFLIDICTCFTCGMCGGEEVYQSAKEHLSVDENGFSKDGKFWVRHAECLGACDTAPVAQVANQRIVHNLDPEKFKNMVAEIKKNGKLPAYEPVPPIDQSMVFDDNGNLVGVENSGTTRTASAPAPTVAEVETPTETEAKEEE